MNDVQQIKTIEIARRLLQLGKTEEACQAYTLAIQQLQDEDQPELELEAALYLLQNGGDYKVAYTTFVRLYDRGFDRAALLALMDGAFYQPNVKQMKTRYEKNCKLLEKYPYLFRKDFLPFEELPIQFFPFDDKGYLPFYKAEQQFGAYVNFNYPKITRNFFKDLEKPILAADVFSPYELRYLNDNVRKSEWVGRENHIYLHYTDWAAFCAYLQVWNLKPILEDKKIVFLIEDEISQYPIDFKERFGVDYSQYPVEHIHIREVNRLIWHTQLSSDNGGDFFNEIFDGHPNLLVIPSLMLESVENAAQTIWKSVRREIELTSLSEPLDGNTEKLLPLVDELLSLKNVTDKDILVFIFLTKADLRDLDPAARISPAVFFQPHFSNIAYTIAGKDNMAILYSKQYEKIQESSLFTSFPYIKTFTPLRRPTTSYAATMRFVWNRQQGNLNFYAVKEEKPTKRTAMEDLATARVLNRSYLIDPQSRLFQDSVMVRFEDGKLNPKATFTALAAFLDIPYTESMTYCSRARERDPANDPGNTSRGFETAAVYNTYDEYAGVPERYYIEYFLRDLYEYYGYDFHYYDGAPMDLDRAKELAGQFTIQDGYVREATKQYFYENDEVIEKYQAAAPELSREELAQELTDKRMTSMQQTRVELAQILLRGLHFYNRKGQPLRMMPKLELDPALLEQPLYH